MASEAGDGEKGDHCCFRNEKILHSKHISSRSNSNSTAMKSNDSYSSNRLGLVLSSEGFFAIENSFPKAFTKGRPRVGSSLGKLRFLYLGVQGLGV